MIKSKLKSPDTIQSKEPKQIFPELKTPKAYNLQEDLNVLVKVLEKKYQLINETEKKKREAKYLDSVLSIDLNSNSMELLKIETLMHVLGYKDDRSVINWCNKNDVHLSRIGSSLCANKLNFILAVNKSFIG